MSYNYFYKLNFIMGVENEVWQLHSVELAPSSLSVKVKMIQRQQNAVCSLFT